MVGAYSDNQPDYSWIKPYEVKDFKQYWYPVRQIGGFKNANLKAAVNLETESNIARIGFHTTSKYEDAKAVLSQNGKTVYEQIIDIGPDKPFTKEIEIDTTAKQTSLKADLLTSSNETLISYQPKEKVFEPNLPHVVKPPAPPKDIKNVEELYLTGRRMEQIYSPSVNPFDYYNEALKRDPFDSRTNVIVATNYNKRGMYERAEQHLQKAIKRLTAEYTRPPNTEAFYQLGISLKARGKLDQAFDAFYRASWDSAFYAPAHFQLATISCRKADFHQALEHINQSLTTNSRNTKAKNLKAAILRKLKRTGQAERIIKKVLAYDPLDFFSMNELYLARSARAKSKTIPSNMEAKMHDDVQSYLELAADYMDLRFWDEAIEVVSRSIENKSAPADYPMLHYYLGYLYEQKGQRDKAGKFYKTAAALPTDYCFPFRLESVDVLNAAVKFNNSDTRAYYYLGNCLYEIQPAQAIKMWEKSASLDDSLGIVRRNLGWAYQQSQNDPAKAIASYEKAIECNSNDPIYYLEIDILYERANTPIQKRLALFEQNHQTTGQRKDTLIREISLLVKAGKLEKAIDYLENNWFYVSEGGGREIRNAYVDAHLLRGLQYMDDKQYDKVLADFLAAREYPENLGVSKPKNDRRRPQVNYCIAAAYKALNQNDKAQQFFKESSQQKIRGPRGEARFYQALSLRQLGREEDAAKIFDGLVDSGRKRISDEKTEVDFFAKFGTQQTKQAQQASAHFTLGLGLLGKEKTKQAKEHFDKAVQLNAAHTWAKYYSLKLSE
jgi:tetratricopeptide (TPR) repeat protein